MEVKGTFVLVGKAEKQKASFQMQDKTTSFIYNHKRQSAQLEQTSTRGFWKSSIAAARTGKI